MLELKDFEAAADRLKNVIHNIPLSTSATFSAMTGAEVYLKYENQQKTGSFKVRGAYNKIMKRYAEGDLHAVVASSAGNHAQGVAFAASSVGVKSTIVMPRSTPIAKVSATQGYGADVVLAGNIYDEAYAKACEICEETGAEFIHPFDDEDVMAGQGTIALEILRDPAVCRHDLRSGWRRRTDLRCRCLRQADQPAHPDHRRTGRGCSGNREFLPRRRAQAV